MHVPAALAACLALAALPLLAAPAAAADRECRHARSESLALDLGDARAVVFHVGASRLRLDGRPGRDGRLEGRACASSEDGLGRLRLEQAREGDTLVVRLRREDGPSSWFRANRYAYFDLSGTMPDGIPVTLAVGSGDAWATGLSALDLTVGSGDADARRIRGNVDARVGSGDITVADAGGLHLQSVGSGDVEARGIRGDARVGSIGSGDVELRDVSGSVAVGSLGSGDLDLAGVRGSVTIDSVGSGDVDVRDVGGDLRVRSVGSGSVDHEGIGGQVALPRKR